jgi:lysozyme
MRSSSLLIPLIEASEGFSSTPYLCPAGVPTIGYGSTRYADGRTVTMQDAPVSKQEAIALVQATLTQYEDAVNRYVAVPLKQSQFDALVDFAYNAGAQNLRTSTLLKKLNAGDYQGAANEFPRWNMGGGVVLRGLVKRRDAEKQLFLS